MKIKARNTITLLILIKIIICFVFIFQVNVGSILFETVALASEKEEVSAEKPVSEKEKYNENTVDIEIILKQMKTLKMREKEINQKEAEIKMLEEEVEKKIEKLAKLRNEIKSQISIKETIEQNKIKHLIKAYSAMKAQTAAGLLEKQDRKFAIELLSQMKGETVGKILSYVDQEKAAKLIEGLAKQK